MNLRMQEMIKSAKHIWIYGAGKIARQALTMLSSACLQLPIDGVVVSCKQEEDTKLCGYPIRDITEVDANDNGTVFLIAVSEKYQQEITETLRRHGYHNYVAWYAPPLREIWTLADYAFIDRRRGKKKVCFVLSGYKKFLWKDVFKRLQKFAPEDVDICILSSGLWDGQLAEIAEKNGWSYLSTKINNITLIQNIAIRLFETAEWIYKMDEDIFVTGCCFERMYHMYHYAMEKGHYRAGFVAPLIPVNGYGHIRILDYLKKTEVYEERFGKAVYGGISENKLEKDAEAAAFMWGYQNVLPQLDELNAMLEENDTFSVCGVRFSIGFILFHRSLWEDMDGFPVSGGRDFGVDEIEMCKYCIVNSRAIIVAENTAVGHFSFGQQTEGMKKIYAEQPELFMIKELKQC